MFFGLVTRVHHSIHADVQACTIGGHHRLPGIDRPRFRRRVRTEKRGSCFPVVLQPQRVTVDVFALQVLCISKPRSSCKRSAALTCVHSIRGHRVLGLRLVQSIIHPLCSFDAAQTGGDELIALASRRCYDLDLKFMSPCVLDICIITDNVDTANKPSSSDEKHDATTEGSILSPGCHSPPEGVLHRTKLGYDGRVRAIDHPGRFSEQRSAMRRSRSPRTRLAPQRLAAGTHEDVPGLLITDGRLAGGDGVLLGKGSETVDIGIQRFDMQAESSVAGCVFVAHVCEGLVWQGAEIGKRGVHLVTVAFEESTAPA